MRPRALAPGSDGPRWLATTFLKPLTERLRFVALAQRARWRLQNVQYAELFVSGILGAIADPGALREWFRALALDLREPNGIPQVNLVVCLSRTRVARQADRIVDLARAGLITGIAIAGDELACPVRDFQEQLRRIREHGIGIEIHVARPAVRSGCETLSTLVSLTVLVTVCARSKIPF